MRIGVIGAGNIGATAARLFARAGHEVAIANSRGPGPGLTLGPGARKIRGRRQTITSGESVYGYQGGGGFRGW